MKRLGGVEKGNFGIASVLVLVLILSPSIASADYVDAVSTATEITDLTGAPEGVQLGWFLYEISLVWDFTTASVGLSHWDLVMKPECLDEDHIIIFPDITKVVPLQFPGFSTGEGYSEPEPEGSPPDESLNVEYLGLLEPDGDSSTTNFDNPVIKYEEYVWVLPYVDPTAPGDSAGHTGFGFFSFYSNIIPETIDPDTMDLTFAKADLVVIPGTFEGDYPSCNVVPEPASIMLLGFGALILRKKRK
jgi:hypothetical protein